MKKFLLLLILPTLLTLGSCQKTEYVNPNRTIFVDIAPTSWSIDGDRKWTYYTVVDMPEIDNYFNDHGAVMVYLSFDGVTYEQIPNTYDNISYYYDHQPGKLVITQQNYQDFGRPKGVVTAKIVLIDSN